MHSTGTVAPDRCQQSEVIAAGDLALLGKALPQLPSGSKPAKRGGTADH